MSPSPSAVAGVAVVVAAVGCGGASASTDAAPPVELAIAAPAPASDDAPPRPPPPAPRPDDPDLSTCIERVRDAVDVPGAGAAHDLYREGRAREKRHDVEEARKHYFDVVDAHATSRLVPYAYLAFGELFAVEAESDPSKRPFAVQSYREVLKYPPPHNTAFGYANLRLGQHEQAHEPPEALSSFKRVIDSAARSGRPCDRVFAGQARVEIVVTYAEVGHPGKAFAFFETLASEAEAMGMVASLAAIYHDRSAAADACAAATAANPGDSVSASLAQTLRRKYCP